MGPIESEEYNGVDVHGWKQVASRKRIRKQKPAAKGTNGAAEETATPDWEVSLAKAAAKIGPFDLTDFLERVPDPYPPVSSYRISRFLDYYKSALSGVPCPWREMFKESDLPNLFDVFHVPLSYIPEPAYQTSVDWLDQQISDMSLCDFVLCTFNYILCDLFIQQGGQLTGLLVGHQPGVRCKSEVAIFVTLAMIVHSKPHVLTRVLPALRTQRQYRGQGRIPLTIWLIAQASQDNLPVGLYSWAHNLLPLARSNPQSRDVILKLVEKILAKPDALTILVNAPVWEGELLIPPHSFVILLLLTFPATSTREENTSRFEAIYPLLKKVALAGTSGSEEIKQIFTFSLILAREGNTVLAKEATAIAIWSLTKNVDCWKHWENIYEKNLEASVALHRKLVGQCKDSTLGSKAMIQQIFTFSMKLAGEENPVLPKKTTAIAIWSLTIIVDCWKHRGVIYEEKLKACVALLKNLVEKWKDHSLQLSSSPRDTLAGSPGSKAMKQITRNIFIFSLRLAGEGNTVLAEEATAIAIWSLNVNVDCWKHWDNLYKENVEASVALLKKLVDEWKDHSLKLISSPSDTLTVSQIMKSFMVKNKKAITQKGANASLYKEADKSCKVISGRLSHGSSSLKGTTIMAVVLAVGALSALVLSSNP